MKVLVLGATGHTGRMSVAALRDRGVEVIACGRNEGALAKLAAPGVETRVVDVRSKESVMDAMRGADAVANLAGPFLKTGHLPIEAAIARGIPYADTTGEQYFMRLARERFHKPAELAGVPVVNALAYEYAFSDLAARVHFPEGGDALHVLYRNRQASGSAGTKKSMVRVLAAPALGYESGGWVKDTPARWNHRFATIDGPRDGLSFAGGESLTIPRHTPFASVRTYFPGPVSRARRVRMLAPLARALVRGPILAGIEKVIDARHRPPANQNARGEIYLDAVRGGVSTPILIATPDPYLATAEVLAEGITRLARGGDRGGVLAPAQALDARATLDAMVQRMPTFSVGRPPSPTVGAAAREKSI